MAVRVERFVTGPLETNTYLVAQAGGTDCFVVDPSKGCSEVLECVETDSLRVAGVLLTHAHFDHCLGIGEILDRYSDAEVYAHPLAKTLLRDPQQNGSWMVGGAFTYEGSIRELAEGAVGVAGIDMTVLHVPGHSPGGCAFVLENYCICGDALFAGSIGRTDFPGSDGPTLLKMVREKLFVLPEETVVCPGHGERTTIGREKRLNPFFR